MGLQGESSLVDICTCLPVHVMPLAQGYHIDEVIDFPFFCRFKMWLMPLQLGRMDTIAAPKEPTSGMLYVKLS